ncbi:MAG: DUF2203 domain-containing protein [Actinomycetota bacterium]
MTRRYSVAEAQALLPELRERVPRIRASRRTLLVSASRIRDAVDAEGGGVDGGRPYWEAQRTLREEIERLAALDVLLRDSDPALVDFPSERDGEPIYLCWREPEETVAWWHPVDTGYAGRRPL